MPKKKSDMEKLSEEISNLSLLFDDFKEKTKLEDLGDLSVSEISDFITEDVPDLQKDIEKIEKSMNDVQDYLEKIEGEAEETPEQ